MPRRILFRMVPLALFAALIAALSVSPPRLAAQGGSNTRVPPITKPDPFTPGVYPLYDYRNLSKSQYHVVGGVQSFDWRVMEPSEGNYNWTKVDQWVAAEWAAGKPVILGVEIYNPSIQYRIPDYVMAGAPVVSCGTNGVRKVPRYWSPFFLEKYRKFMLAFGARYRNDPRVVAVQIGAGIYEETQPETSTYKPCVRDAMAADIGSNDAEALSVTWMNTVIAISAAYKEGFGDAKPLLLQYVPYFLNYWERDGWPARNYEGFVPFAIRNGIGMKHAGLLPDHWVGTGYDPIKKNWGKVNGGFEPPNGYTLDQEIYWAVFAALDAHADYLMLHPNHFLNDCGNQTNGCKYDMPMVFAAYDFFNRYAGKRPANTPGAWVALRDSWYYHGSRDNYSWFLYQDLNAVGGKPKSVSYMTGPTQPNERVSTLMSTDATIGSFKESRWTRRTDSASGNPNMFFGIDDSYIYSGTNAVEFKVTYFDVGTDQWRLVYDGPGESLPVAHTQTKTNSRTWKQATFTVTDGHFANGISNNDFRLESMGDGDEYFHFIEIIPTTPRVCPWGDRDGSGDVDVGDLVLVASHWREAVPLHDADRDGLITVMDLQSIGKEFGQNCQ